VKTVLILIAAIAVIGVAFGVCLYGHVSLGLNYPGHPANHQKHIHHSSHSPHHSSGTAKTGNRTRKSAKPKSDFSFKVLEVEKTSTLSRLVKAELINHGGDKEKVRVLLEAFCGKDRINLNGKKSICVWIGNMRKNESVVKSIKISVGFFDALKIKSEGKLKLVLKVLWTANNTTHEQVFSRVVSV